MIHQGFERASLDANRLEDRRGVRLADCAAVTAATASLKSSFRGDERV